MPKAVKRIINLFVGGGVSWLRKMQSYSCYGSRLFKRVHG